MPDDIAALKARALKAGEEAHWHWYADDRSDDPVDPPARIRLVLTDPDTAGHWLAAGAAERAGADIVLSRDWDSPRPALSYVRVWADAVAGVLAAAGIATRKVLEISDRLDTASLKRGLAMIDSVGRIGVEDILARRQVFVSRAGTGPFVLEVAPGQAARARDWLAGTGLPLVRAGTGVRLALGTDPAAAIPVIVEALRHLEDSPATTLVARYAPGPAEPWPGD